jgi:plasmid stability protein
MIAEAAEVMTQLIVRKLDETVKRKLKQRAARHGRSMEEEVRDILRDAVKDEKASATGLGSQIAGRFTGIELEQSIKPVRIKLRLPKFG